MTNNEMPVSEVTDVTETQNETETVNKNGRIYPFPKNSVTTEQLAKEAIEKQGERPEDFDQLPVMKMGDDGSIQEVKKSPDPELTKEQVREVISKELGREVSDEELERVAKRMQYKTVAYPKFPIEFKEMRGMLFHLFTKTILENGEHKPKRIFYKGTNLSLEERKNKIKENEVDLYYIFSNKRKNLAFSIKSGGDYDFEFIRGGQRQLRRLINSSFLTHFNEIVETEKAKAQLKEAPKANDSQIEEKPQA